MCAESPQHGKRSEPMTRNSSLTQTALTRSSRRSSWRRNSRHRASTGSRSLCTIRIFTASLPFVNVRRQRMESRCRRVRVRAISFRAHARKRERWTSFKPMQRAAEASPAFLRSMAFVKARLSRSPPTVHPTFTFTPPRRRRCCATWSIFFDHVRIEKMFFDGPCRAGRMELWRRISPDPVSVSSFAAAMPTAYEI